MEWSDWPTSIAGNRVSVPDGGSVAVGIHPKIVQERLGHSSVNMTLGRYSHVGETMQHDAALKITETLGLSGDRAQNVTNSDSVISESASGLGKED